MNENKPKVKMGSSCDRDGLTSKEQTAHEREFFLRNRQCEQSTQNRGGGLLGLVMKIDLWMDSY